MRTRAPSLAGAKMPEASKITIRKGPANFGGAFQYRQKRNRVIDYTPPSTTKSLALEDAKRRFTQPRRTAET